MVHFAFEFYGFATYNVLINPSDPVAKSVLATMIKTGDYFFFALGSDRNTTAFRSDVRAPSLAGLHANMIRIQGSITSEAQHQAAVAVFAKRPEPPGTMLTWVCWGEESYLDLEHDRLVLRPA